MSSCNRFKDIDEKKKYLGSVFAPEPRIGGADLDPEAMRDTFGMIECPASEPCCPEYSSDLDPSLEGRTDSPCCSETEHMC